MTDTSLEPEERQVPAVNEDDLATNAILAIHKLVRYAQLYLEENEAITKQLEMAMFSVAEYGKKTGKNLKVFFSTRSVWVGSALLRAPRSVYETALELGKLFKRWQINEMAIGFDAPIDDFRVLVDAVREARTSGTSPANQRYVRIRLRQGHEPFRGPAHLQDSNLGEAGKLIRAYVTSVVIMRRFFERVQKGNYSMPARVRRTAQQLAELEAVQMPAFLAATTLRNAASDNASQAVHAALLALGMARLVTTDTLLLMRLAMATLLYDTGKPRVAGDDPFGDARLGGMMPRLGEEQFQELPAATAAMSIIMSGLNDAANFYSVLCFEAWHVRYHDHCPAPYQATRPISLEARIVAYARHFTELLASEEETYTPDTAFAVLLKHAREPVDRSVVRLLLAALGLFPSGALVLLSTGETAQVARVNEDPTMFSRPIVRVLVDARGNRLAQAREIDLGEEQAAAPSITRLLSMGDETPAAAPLSLQQPRMAPPPPPPPPQPQPPPPPPPPPPPQEQVALARVAIARKDADGLLVRSDLQQLEAPVRIEAAPPEIGGEPQTMVGASAEQMMALMRQQRAAPVPPQAPPVPSAPPVASAPPIESDDAPTPLPTDPIARARHIVGQRLRPIKPIAHGTLQATSLTGVMAQCLARQFGGSLLLLGPDGGIHVVAFEGGLPAKVLSTSTIAPLDEILREMGAIDDETLAWSLAESQRSGELHGQILVRHDRLPYDTLLEALSWQLRRKLYHLHQLPVATRFAVYEGVDALDDYGGPELTPYETSALVLDGLRARPDDPSIAETLAQIGGAFMSLQPEADLGPLELSPEELAVAELLAQPLTLEQLLGAGVAHEQVVLVVVHALGSLGLLELSVDTAEA